MKLCVVITYKINIICMFVDTNNTAFKITKYQISNAILV